ncbi:unnamed protein product [Lactuca virosa]|uniref:Uncharacterized protein n=1 Tax=Lactuca virosa TaxID=75947 RepID=A0AAU9N546_9ASTR|nr:unnamed protein product [Lactuca virosa]
MFNPQKQNNFVIQIRGSNPPQTNPSPTPTFSSMKIFNRFRRIFMRFMFSIPSSKATTSSSGGGSAGLRRRSCDRPDPPRRWRKEIGFHGTSLSCGRVKRVCFVLICHLSNFI